MQGRGHHKVILLGEHAVVHGHPALGSPVDRGVEVEVEILGKGPRLGVTLEGGTDEVHEALVRMAREAGASDVALGVRVRSDLEAGAGLGGSAALCVGFSRAVLGLLGVAVTPDMVIGIAQAGERVFHGNPSGIDATLASAPGPLLFRKGHEPTPVTLGRDLHLAVLVMPVRSPTSRMVGIVQDRIDSDPSGTGELFGSIATLVSRAAGAAGQGEIGELGGLMSENQELLRRLGVSTDALDRMCDRAIRAGALGAKLTGAGGGGAVLALCPDPGLAREVALEAGRDADHAFTTTIRRGGVGA
jgi:mevalonate kinase